MADAADYLGSKGGKAKASLVSRDAKSITFKLADADFYLRYSYIIDFDGSKHMADLGGKTSNGKRDYDVTVEVLDKDMKPMDGKSYKASIKNNVNATLNEDGITRLPQITDRKRPRMTVKFKGKNAEAKKAFKGLWFYLDIMPVEINERNVTGSVEKPKKEGLPPRFKKLSFTNAYDKSFGMKSKKNTKKSDFDYTPGETGVTIRGRNNYRGTKFLSYTIK